ncbi:MAG: 2-oxoglutarate dehydrogenase complex dihydrolipoyllysine-residue succinyltransferase [SAR324 cluster bacterium]|nr:2-oxoglutarate dehydrogenase complex dihydrolipoyllysine-residue succinyltransferase [SAR324 cluster bacterium]
MSLVEIKIPTPGESITEDTNETWNKADGEFDQVDEIMCEIETDKATLPMPAEVPGTVQIVLQEGSDAKVGDVLCKIDTAGVPSADSSEPTTQSSNAVHEKVEQSGVGYAAGHPSPAAHKLMNEAEISADQVQGSGPGNRITKQDVELAKSQQTPPAKTEATPVVNSSQSKPDGEAVPKSSSREQRREKMSRLRTKLSERLVAVKNETAMLTTFNEVDMSAIFGMRKDYKEKFEKKYGQRLGFMGFFTKAVSEAVQDFPAVNAMIDDNEIVYSDFVDIGIAVSAPKGLVVPVVRNAESLTIPQIELEIGRLAKRARDNKLSVEEMTGGTFSITNGGVFGSMLSTPIINPPQSAILGMHTVVERPLALNGQVVIRPVMYLALSYDHRIIDGRESVSFLFKVKEYLENPARILLGV